eukprot:GHVL01029335.1.p3 GENE.GHVL01029335.1~~GHVL01029335.1.p3  ORF type:complete len:118 (-),score=14.97 GHVL01029335.1:1911-2264(-)
MLSPCEGLHIEDSGIFHPRPTRLLQVLFLQRVDQPTVHKADALREPAPVISCCALWLQPEKNSPAVLPAQCALHFGEHVLLASAALHFFYSGKKMETGAVRAHFAASGRGNKSRADW